MIMKNPSHLAWTVLITALIIFCVTATAAVLGIRWFLLDSTTGLTVTLTVGRGTVGVQSATGDAAEQAERHTRVLTRDTRLTTDSASQGYITFQDPHTQEIVASLVLHNDSTIVLGDAARPRFDFSQNGYTITFFDAQGSIDIDIVPELTRQIQFDVQSDLGRVRMTNSGHYLLDSQDDLFAVQNRGGEVLAINADLQARSVPQGMEGRILAEQSTITLNDTLVDILPDGGFDTFNPANPALSSDWGCYSTEDEQGSARGEYGREIINRSPVMHINRRGQPDAPANNHAETGCLQYLNTVGEAQPIADYNYLELRATLLIRFQSLSVCGVAGSECPIMLVINYQDAGGSSRQWIHGFYAYQDPAQNYPLRCATCALDHERINLNTWYTYTSGNLLQLLPDDQRPVAIENVHFYASGHEYEVLLSEVALLAGEPETNQQTEEPETAPDVR